ncbi:DUF1592 domain-containing protein [Planctomycetaceae bacterium SH139]
MIQQADQLRCCRQLDCARDRVAVRSLRWPPRLVVTYVGLLSLLACNQLATAQPLAPQPLPPNPQTPNPQASSANLQPAVRTLLQNHCVDCHSGAAPLGGIDLAELEGEDSITPKTNGSKIESWERVVRKLRAGEMPPADAEPPPATLLSAALDSLETRLDELAERAPRPGRTATFRRLTRLEYQYAIRDLLALDIDTTTLLPADEISHGFDNITVGGLSPTLVNRYISAADTISQLAVGRSTTASSDKTYRIPPDVTQEQHVVGLPLGTRGGTVFSHTFPRDGEYEIRVRLARDRNEHVEGLFEPHALEILLDLARVKVLTVKPPSGGAPSADGYGTVTHANVDRHLIARVPVTAGRHQVGVTFLKQATSLLETKRQPLNVHYNMYRHPRVSPAVYQVSITGPHGQSTIADTPSRQRIFTSRAATGEEEEEEAAAQKIIRQLLRRATRRSVDESDLAGPLELYRQGRQAGDFELGIELALSSILVHPRFLFRIESAPRGIASGTSYQINDWELASRLSFFLWSSIPDEELLSLAELGTLHRTEVLEQQTRRMLADPRAAALVTNFAAQWLYLRNLAAFTPDARLYPDFDDNLRQAFRRETELCFSDVMHADHSVLRLLKSNYTFLNERLAKHYGIPHVYGSHFRRVELAPDSERGGLLRQGSILSVTSYATRTSPVLRGTWILENLLGTPPPPPPPDIPALSDNTVSASLSGRERLAQHRADPACASCHDRIDPIGFALENFDAVGRWRVLENGYPIDAAGGLPDGSRFDGVDGLESGLLDRPQQFVGTMAEKMLTYALGRGVEYHDAAAIRKIVRDAEADDYRFSSLVLGIVKSIPFQQRTAE